MVFVVIYFGCKSWTYTRARTHRVYNVTVETSIRPLLHLLDLCFTSAFGFVFCVCRLCWTFIVLSNNYLIYLSKPRMINAWQNLFLYSVAQQFADLMLIGFTVECWCLQDCKSFFTKFRFWCFNTSISLNWSEHFLKMCIRFVFHFIGYFGRHFCKFLVIGRMVLDLEMHLMNDGKHFYL